MPPLADPGLAPLRECRSCLRPVRVIKRGQCNTCYQKSRRDGAVESLIGADPARTKIAELVDAGWSYRDITRASGVDRFVIAHIVDGRALIQIKTHSRLAAIDVADRSRWTRPPRGKCPKGCTCAKHDGRGGWGARKRKLASQINGVRVGNLVVCCGDCDRYPCQCHDEDPWIADAWMQRATIPEGGDDAAPRTQFETLFGRTR